MQRTVLTQMRVDVYKVKIYDVAADECRVSRRMATTLGAQRMGGEIVPETRTLIDPAHLEPNEQWTARDFIPQD